MREQVGRVYLRWGMNLKAIVIGLGSMGQRRIRLLKMLDKTIEVVGIDILEARRTRAEIEFGIKTYERISTVDFEDHETAVAFVCASPLSHSTIISECLNAGLHTFTEINLSDNGYSDNVHLADSKGLVLFLSSTQMYRREIGYIRDAILKSNSKPSYIYHVGQYLPDWHPWENYKDFFVGDKRTNGCREIMAIEFPWLFDIFGFPEKWKVQKMRNSLLDIDYSDVFQILLGHPDGSNGIIQFDVVSRKAVRYFECISEDLYISWDGTPNGLKKYDYMLKEDRNITLYDIVDKRSGYSPSIIEDAYMDEIREFLNTIKGIAKPRYTFDKDEKILRLINEIGA